ncbi:MAG: hypothetical protein NTX26_01345 [Candidatus Parcubacteria bacterium]|nr:hypothetical protein [Candidatus Parcubacteria bacterium]
MRKFFIIFLAICLCLPLSIALATDEAGGGGSSTGVLDLNIFTPGDLQTTIDRALGILWVIAIPVSLIMCLWAGIEFISSAGDPKKVTAAKNRIKYTLIGLVVMILASSAVALVQSLFIAK